MSVPCPLFGFDVRLRFRPGLSEDAADALMTAFVQAVEARGLGAGGGGDATGWSLTIEPGAVQAIDADREALASWAAARGEIADVFVGPLVDLSDGASRS
jgi:uncharacterized protein YggL (DUF469 family)